EERSQYETVRPIDRRPGRRSAGHDASVQPIKILLNEIAAHLGDVGVGQALGDPTRHAASPIPAPLKLRTPAMQRLVEVRNISSAFAASKISMSPSCDLDRLLPTKPETSTRNFQNPGLKPFVFTGSRNRSVLFWTAVIRIIIPFQKPRDTAQGHWLHI